MFDSKLRQLRELYAEDRPNDLIYAIHYGLITKKELDKYYPHVVLFGSHHVETLLRVSPSKDEWMIFNSKNFPSFFKSVKKRLDDFYDKIGCDYEFVVPSVSEIVYGRALTLFDPIPEELFYAGSLIGNPSILKMRRELSLMIDYTLPRWMSKYSNIQLFRYFDGNFQNVSIREIMRVGCIDDYLNRASYQGEYDSDLHEIDYEEYVSYGEVNQERECSQESSNT